MERSFGGRESHRYVVCPAKGGVDTVHTPICFKQCLGGWWWEASESWLTVTVQAGMRQPLLSTKLVPWGMAMNLHVPADLDRRLAQLAAEERTSKTALLLQGAELVLQALCTSPRNQRGRDLC